MSSSGSEPERRGIEVDRALAVIESGHVFPPVTPARTRVIHDAGSQCRAAPPFVVVGSDRRQLDRPAAGTRSWPRGLDSLDTEATVSASSGSTGTPRPLTAGPSVALSGSMSAWTTSWPRGLHVVHGAPPGLIGPLAGTAASRAVGTDGPDRGMRAGPAGSRRSAWRAADTTVLTRNTKNEHVRPEGRASCGEGQVGTIRRDPATELRNAAGADPTAVDMLVGGVEGPAEVAVQKARVGAVSGRRRACRRRHDGDGACSPGKTSLCGASVPRQRRTTDRAGHAERAVREDGGTRRRGRRSARRTSSRQTANAHVAMPTTSTARHGRG